MCATCPSHRVASHGSLLVQGVMPGCGCQGVKSAASSGPRKGLHSRRNRDGQRQSWNTNTNIFYVHKREKTETNRDRAGNGCTNRPYVLLKSCHSWETVPPASEALLQTRTCSSSGSRMASEWKVFSLL